MSKILFLPEGYESPKSSSFYMKFQEGENKFRILSRPVMGWEDWKDKKPLRFQMHEKPVKSIDIKKPIKHFWSMIVWNYSEEEIQILHLTQSTIRKSLESLCADLDWGAPYFYDLKVIKSGEGIETEYVLNPLPHKPLHPMVEDRFQERRCNLDALFYNEDPFEKEQTSYTEGIFLESQLEKKDESPCELTLILEECEKSYREWFYSRLKTQYLINKPSEMPPEIYKRALSSAKKNMEDHHKKQQKEFEETPFEAVL